MTYVTCDPKEDTTNLLRSTVRSLVEYLSTIGTKLATTSTNEVYLIMRTNSKVGAHWKNLQEFLGVMNLASRPASHCASVMAIARMAGRRSTSALHLAGAVRSRFSASEEGIDRKSQFGANLRKALPPVTAFGNGPAGKYLKTATDIPTGQIVIQAQGEMMERPSTYTIQVC